MSPDLTDKKSSLIFDKIISIRAKPFLLPGRGRSHFNE